MKANLVIVCALFAAQVAQAQETTEPAQLRALRTSWEASRKKALQPIDATYTQELQKLLDVLTKAGRLDEAVSVKNELAKLGANPGVRDISDGKVPTSSKAATGEIQPFVGKKWQTRNGTIFTFHNDGTGEQELGGKKVPTKWTFGKDNVVVVEGDKDNKKAFWYFKFTGRKEGTFGSSPAAIDNVLTVK